MGRRAAPPATPGNHVLLMRWTLLASAGLLLASATSALLIAAATPMRAATLLTVAWMLAAAMFVVGLVRVLGVGVTLDRRSGLLTVRNLHRTERIWVRDVTAARVVVAPWAHDHAVARWPLLRPSPLIELVTAKGTRIRLHATACDHRADRVATLELLHRARIEIDRAGADRYVAGDDARPSHSTPARVSPGVDA